jgi:hypothetical protein
MAALRKFIYSGVHVDVFAKSIRFSGMHDCVFLGTTPDDDQIKRLIDAIQRPMRTFPIAPVPLPRSREQVYRLNIPPEERKRSLRERFIIWWYKLEKTDGD